jgi:serine/threonine protein kinase
MMSLRPHKNVVQLRGVCPSPLCVVIDFVDGGSLESRLADKKKDVGWPKVFQWSQGIVAGLHHIHMEKIVHRDLASRNVLLDAMDNALISDFGLSAVGRNGPGSMAPSNAIQEVGFFRGPYKVKCCVFMLWSFVDKRGSGWHQNPWQRINLA